MRGGVGAAEFGQYRFAAHVFNATVTTITAPGNHRDRGPSRSDRPSSAEVGGMEQPVRGLADTSFAAWR